MYDFSGTMYPGLSWGFRLCWSQGVNEVIKMWFGLFTFEIKNNKTKKANSAFSCCLVHRVKKRKKANVFY